jgi:hypothetical protein
MTDAHSMCVCMHIGTSTTRLFADLNDFERGSTNGDHTEALNEGIDAKLCALL